MSDEELRSEEVVFYVSSKKWTLFLAYFGVVNLIKQEYKSTLKESLGTMQGSK